jgi:hypothetical protein
MTIHKTTTISKIRKKKEAKKKRLQNTEKECKKIVMK